MLTCWRKKSIRTMDERNIQVHLPYTTDPDHRIPAIPIDWDTTVEDIIIKCCKSLNIAPTARHLYGLRPKPKPITWLNLSYKLADSSIKDYVLAIRFHPSDADRLLQMNNMVAFDFYFRQARHHLLTAKIPKFVLAEHESKINRLCVEDMYRSMEENLLRKRHVERKFRVYFPKGVNKLHRWFLKKPVLGAFDDMVNNGPINLVMIKLNYLRKFREIFPDYLREEFYAYVKEDGSNLRVLLRVNPFDADYPGISIIRSKKVQPERIRFDDLCCITTIRDSKDKQIEILTKNSGKLILKFDDQSTVRSFVSLLDGYYRLMVKWTFNLCSDYKTPSLEKLLEQKCHGPVGTNFAHKKLNDVRKNVPGSCILRESRDSFHTYFIDVCTETRLRPFTYKIEEKNDGSYGILDKEEVCYKSLSELVRIHRFAAHNVTFLRCEPPSEDDQSDLLMCSINVGANLKNQAEIEERERGSTVEWVNVDTLSITPDCLPDDDGVHAYTTVHRVHWPKYNKRELVIKRLRERIGDENLKDFLSLANGWASVKTDAVVQLYAVSLDPVSMIMEYVPKGRLDTYLKNPDNRLQIKEINLVQASVSLAEALYYLQTIKFVHGNIRCRKLLVYAHTDTFLEVKLAEPGLSRQYEDFDLHWIPPEHHDNTSGAKTSTKADIWAFATTLWEIYNYGSSPKEVSDPDTAREFYKPISRQVLPKPFGCRNWPKIYNLIKECWNPDKDLRKKPQAILQEIKGIFWSVSNNPEPISPPEPYPEEDDRPIMPPDDNGSLQDNLADSDTESVSSRAHHPDSEDTSSIIYFGSHDSNPYIRVGLTNVEEDAGSADTISYQLMPVVIPQPDSATPNKTVEFGSYTLHYVKRLGEGNFGTVYKAVMQYINGDAIEVAVKEFKADNTNKTDFMKEVQIMSELCHENIIQIKCYAVEPEPLLIMEYSARSSLKNCLYTYKEELTSLKLLKIARDIASGMAYLKEKNIVHRDLSARNIIIMDDDEWKAKICDFGLARLTGNKQYYTMTSQTQLPIQWYAPESLLKPNKFTTKSDVWSYGVTLIEMFSYGANPTLPNVNHTFEDLGNALKNGMRLQRPRACPLYIYEKVISPCWEYEPSDRPTFDNLRKLIAIELR